MMHDYKIAGLRVRFHGPSPIEAGVASFAKFAAECDPAAHCTAEFRLGEELHTDDFDFGTIHEFEFPDARHDCIFGRSGDAYIFIMRPWGCGDTSRDTIFTKAFGSAEVRSNAAAGADPDPSLVRFGIWMMFGIAAAAEQAVAVHSSVIVKDGGAVMFLGESGTGKSTHTRLWRENIEGAKLLNDDSPIVRIVDGRAMVFGSPWSGKTHCYVDAGFPIKGVVRLSQAPHNRMRRLDTLGAFGALWPSCPPAFAPDDGLQGAVCDILSEVLSQVPVWHLECLPDGAAARLSYKTVFGSDE